MSFSPETIDRIVANVLSQLSTPRVVAPVISAEKKPAPVSVTTHPAQDEAVGRAVVILHNVITAETLSAVPVNGIVQLSPKALVTPAARDSIKERKLTIVRQSVSANASVEARVAPNSKGSGLLIVVRSSKAVEQLVSEQTGIWRRELVGCPDDAAKLAISELCRGGTSQVVILAEQTHRAACLANRNEAAKAVAVRDAGDIRLIRKQLRANVWCIDGTGKTYFELKNIFREIQS